MKRVRLLHVPFLALTFSLSLLLSPLFAQTFKPVFSKQYTHPRGSPNSLSDPFTACDPTGTFRIVVVNGPGGQRPVSGGSIFLNGVEIIGLKHNVEVIERPLSSVLRDNLLEVRRLRGGPGGTIQVTVEGIQNCVAVKITSPATESIIQRPTTLVLGQVTGPPGAELTVTVNGVPAQVNDGVFGGFIPLELGANLVTARVVDSFGNSAVDSIVVLREEPIGQPDFLAIWNALKDTLRKGDIEAALSFIVEKSRERYRGIFTALGPQLSEIDLILTDISPVAIRQDDAEFEMFRSGRSFHILFARDDDGIWRLASF